MILDFVASTGYYTLRFNRGEADASALMKEHGLDFSLKASHGNQAVMMTQDPYCAATFAEHATPQARAELGWILKEVEASWSDGCTNIYRAPADKKLWPFQSANVAYALQRKCTLIGDQPGLGKTPTAIVFANEIRAKRVLVIVPANIRRQWANKIREWSTMRWPYVVYAIETGSRGVHPSAEWTIVSYDLARTPAIGAALARGQYDLLIIDEAHYVKSVDAGRTHAIFGDHTGSMRRIVRDERKTIVGHDVLFPALASRSERILALTGTPLPNRPRECYTLARGLCFDAIDFTSEDCFRERYNPSARIEGIRKDGTPYVYNREEAGRSGELQNRLRAHFMTRHVKRGPRGVANQLKLPAYELIQVDETAAVKAALKAESMLHFDPEDEEFFQHADAAVLGQIAAVRHQMGLAIAPFAADYVEMLLEGGEDKVFLIGWHIGVLDMLQQKLHKYGLIRIDGSIPGSKRQVLVDEFRNEPKKRILLGNIQAVGTGTDGLQDVCTRAVFAEYDWVPGVNQQAVDRLDRMGQKQQVNADFLVAGGSLGEKIMASALRKLDMTDRCLDKQFAL